MLGTGTWAVKPLWESMAAAVKALAAELKPPCDVMPVTSYMAGWMALGAPGLLNVWMAAAAIKHTKCICNMKFTQKY